MKQKDDVNQYLNVRFHSRSFILVSILNMPNGGYDLTLPLRAEKTSPKFTLVIQRNLYRVTPERCM